MTAERHGRSRRCGSGDKHAVVMLLGTTGEDGWHPSYGPGVDMFWVDDDRMDDLMQHERTIHAVLRR